jgi:hypothetical protein
LPIDFKKEPVYEDKIIIDFAHFTNSVLLASDSVFRDRALADGRPTMFISPKDLEGLKKIEETGPRKEDTVSIRVPDKISRAKMLSVYFHKALFVFGNKS